MKGYQRIIREGDLRPVIDFTREEFDAYRRALQRGGDFEALHRLYEGISKKGASWIEIRRALGAELLQNATHLTGEDIWRISRILPVEYYYLVLNRMDTTLYAPLYKVEKSIPRRWEIATRLITDARVRVAWVANMHRSERFDHLGYGQAVDIVWRGDLDATVTVVSHHTEHPEIVTELFTIHFHGEDLPVADSTDWLPSLMPECYVCGRAGLRSGGHLGKVCPACAVSPTDVTAIPKPR